MLVAGYWDLFLPHRVFQINGRFSVIYFYGFVGFENAVKHQAKECCESQSVMEQVQSIARLLFDEDEILRRMHL